MGFILYKKRFMENEKLNSVTKSLALSYDNSGGYL